MNWFKKLLGIPISEKNLGQNHLSDFYQRKAQREALLSKLPLPPKLQMMLDRGKWLHPEEGVMQQVAPFIKDPLHFPQSHDEMIRESSILFMEHHQDEDKRSHEYKGSKTGPYDLPWQDVELALNIIINREIGDDIAIALDYRTGLSSPRVIGQEYAEDYAEGFIRYHEIAATFDDFVEMLYG